jgi:hypothetical protein
MKNSKLDDYTIFYLLDFSQYLIVYFILSLIGLRFVYRVEDFVLEDIDVDKPNIHSFIRRIIEIIVMLAINIIVYILILVIGKSIPSLSTYFYPKMASNTVITFIEDFIILFVLVLGDERLEYHISTLRD